MASNPEVSLDDELDRYNEGVPKHLGQIAITVSQWEGRLADELGLTSSDVSAINLKQPRNLELQT